MSLKHALRIVVLVVGGIVGLVADSAAQFETPSRQFHNDTAFPLDGQHRAVACESCHVQGAYKGTPSRCFDCHWERRQDDRFRLQLGSQCEQCHRPVSWTAVRWDHGSMTGTPLNTSHRQISCQSCHVNSDVRRGAVGMCVSCHQQDFQSTRNPNHLAAGFSTACETCHRPGDQRFQGTGLNHAAVFPLIGRHAQQTCAACHVNNVFRGTSRDCVGCHRTVYDRTTTPSHVAAGFSTACESCHRASDPSFRGTVFNHAAVFPLVGQHTQQTCVACHVNNVFRGTSRDCVGCHRTVYDRTTTPSHVAAGFSTACESCHRATDPSFRGAVFNHASVFALVGRHTQTTCAACHVNNVYRNTPRDCVGCHRAAYNRTTSPNHMAAGFPTACESCHRAADTSFSQGTFTHRFPITSGPHRQGCATCHQASSFQTFSCVVCHEHDRAQMDREHRNRNGYRYDSLACYSCHPTGRH